MSLVILEERNIELEDRSIEIIHIEPQRKPRVKKKEIVRERRGK